MIISTLRVGPAQSTGQGWREFAAGPKSHRLGIWARCNAPVAIATSRKGRVEVFFAP